MTMETLSNINDLSHLIQLVVAPVFLLAGIAGFLNVMAGRLGRIVDRSRVLEERSTELAKANPQRYEKEQKELVALRRRIRLNNRSIGFCTFAGLWVCLLVMMLFVGSYWNMSIGAGIVAFFVLAMLSLMTALVLFLKETQLASRTIRMVDTTHS